MVSVNLSKTEYTNQTGTGTAPAASGKKTTSSAWDVPGARSSSSGQQAGQTELQTKLKKEIEELLSKYEGVSLADLENIRKNLNINELQHKDLTEEKITKFISFLKEVLDASVVNGRVDKKKLEAGLKEGKERYEYLSKGLVGVLVQKGYLRSEDIPKGAKSLKNVDREVLKKAVEKLVTDSLGKLKKGDNTDKIDVFKDLISGTSEEDITILWDVLKETIIKNDLGKEAISAFVGSFTTPARIRAFIDKLAKEDLTKLGIKDNEQLALTIHDALKNRDPEKIKEAFIAFVDSAVAVYKECNEIIDKVSKYKKENPDTEITDEVLASKIGLSPEEIEKYKIFQRIEAMTFGAMSTACSNNIDITEQMGRLYKMFGQFTMDDFKAQFKKFIEAHKDELSLSSEKMSEFIEKVSKAQTSQSEAATNSKEEQSTSASSDGIGYKLSQEETVLVTDALKLVAELYDKTEDKTETENNKFRVEKRTTTPTDSEKTNVSFANKTAEDIKESIKNGEFSSTADAVCKALKNYKDLSSSAKNWVTDQISTMSKTYRKYIFKKGFCGSVIRYLASKKLIKSNDLKGTGATREQKEEVKRSEEKEKQKVTE